MRRLLNLMTLMSLLLCVAVAALWVRSYWVWDFYQWAGRTGGERPTLTKWVFAASDGGVTVIRSRDIWRPEHSSWLNNTPVGWTREPLPPARLSSAVLLSPWRRLGFGYQSEKSGGEPVMHDQAVSFPFWLPLTASAALPAMRCIRPRRRVRKGLCGRCGYDLRGNVSGLCPECGTSVPQGSE